jgi:hypothetical protein
MHVLLVDACSLLRPRSSWRTPLKLPLAAALLPSPLSALLLLLTR